MATQTLSKTLTNTHVAVATGILLIAAGAAAFAAAGVPREKLFSSMSVSCYDGSRMIQDQYMQVVYRTATSSPQGAPGVPCFTSREAQAIAAAFCAGARNPVTGKTGVNTFSVKGNCEQPPQTPNYGYGYGYGYPAARK